MRVHDDAETFELFMVAIDRGRTGVGFALLQCDSDLFGGEVARGIHENVNECTFGGGDAPAGLAYGGEDVLTRPRALTHQREPTAHLARLVTFKVR